MDVMNAENACRSIFLPMHCLPPFVARPFHEVYPSLRSHWYWQDCVSNDDQLLASASAVFDSLLAAFEKGVSSE